jgi:hypothetical protein
MILRRRPDDGGGAAGASPYAAASPMCKGDEARPLLTLSIGACLCEGMLRLKNSSMRNYDIEMWRYAKELKFRSAG